MKYFIIFAEVEGQDARTEFLHNFNATVSPSSADCQPDYQKTCCSQSPTQLMREAVKQQQHVPSYNFTDWVESETISRCVQCGAPSEAWDTDTNSTQISCI